MMAKAWFKAAALAALLLGAASVSFPAQAVRIKDIASVEGVRDNQLIGYGLVVGLAGTGEKNNKFTEQSFRSMLNNFGIKVDDSTSIKIKDVAPVAIHATLPPFSKRGQSIDVTVSAIGEATSLRGGTLHDIEILPDALGAPRVHLSGYFAQLARSRSVSKVWVSLSHSRAYATAQCVMEG